MRKCHISKFHVDSPMKLTPVLLESYLKAQRQHVSKVFVQLFYVWQLTYLQYEETFVELPCPVSEQWISHTVTSLEYITMRFLLTVRSAHHTFV
jgi:hypothetical protein